MFLYASNWSTPQNLKWLTKNGFPDSGKLVKIYASPTDPREILNRDITVVQESSQPFVTAYRHPARGIWVSEDLEFLLSPLTESEAAQARALFRFAQRKDVGITELALGVRNSIEKRWHYPDPISIIDGLKESIERQRHNHLHLDVFTKQSLERVSNIFHLENLENFASIKEVIQITRESERHSVSRERS